jgi:hypothetical protein
VLELLRIFSKDVDEHDTTTQLNLRQNYVAILSERSPSALRRALPDSVATRRLPHGALRRSIPIRCLM